MKYRIKLLQGQYYPQYQGKVFWIFPKWFYFVLGGFDGVYCFPNEEGARKFIENERKILPDKIIEVNFKNG